MRLLRALAVVAWLAEAMAAAEPAAGVLTAFASAMARANFGAAYDLLSQDDQRVMDREAFVRRYERLCKVPWIGAVLRSARVEEGKLTALDWTYTRFAREGLLGQNGDLATLPRRSYVEGVELRGGKLHLGLGGEGPKPEDASVSVTAASADWFALYATVSARCPPEGRYLLVAIAAEGARGEVAYDCAAGLGRDDLVVWLDSPPKLFAQLSLTATVVGIVARRPPPDPFRAPEPDLLERPSFPTGP
jgi:hypothetical protein